MVEALQGSSAFLDIIAHPEAEAAGKDMVELGFRIAQGTCVVGQTDRPLPPSLLGDSQAGMQYWLQKLLQSIDASRRILPYEAFAFIARARQIDTNHLGQLPERTRHALSQALYA